MARLRGLVRVVKYGAMFALFLFLCCIVSFLCCEHEVPPAVLGRVTAALSSTNVLVTAESASFRFLRGVRVRRLRVFERRRHPFAPPGPARPMVEADGVDLELDLRRIPWRAATLLRRATVTGLRYPRLPEGYYVPDSQEFPGEPDFRERHEPVRLELPEMRPFALRLVRPEILGVDARDVDIPRVSVTPRGIKAERIRLRWRDQDVPMALDGFAELDLAGQRVRGEMRGLARQSGIRPLLVALDITNSYQFIDAFTDAVAPVEAGCRFDVDLCTGDLHLGLDLHPPACRHRGVAVKDVQGPLDIRVFVRDTFQNARIVVGPLRAELADGTRLEGTVVYENTNDVGFVDFDTRFATSISNALAIADAMNDGTLDCLQTETTPEVSLKGRLAVDPAHAKALNDLSGSLAFARGSLFSIDLRQASADFRVKGFDVTFTNALARPPGGGTLQGSAVISVPDGRRENARFDVRVRGDGVSLKDVADMFHVDSGDRHGTLDGTVRLAGPLDTNAVARLSGEGRLVCRDGRLAQLKVFSGLTDVLSRHVPVLAQHAPVLVGLVNQSRASLDFTLSNGVFRTSNLLVEGTTLSVSASGAYDIARDDLDFRVQVTFTRNDSLLSTLATPITWPFANLTRRIFEFKVGGTLDAPTWGFNTSLMDRIRPPFAK